jgi:hypothetical protein
MGNSLALFLNPTQLVNSKNSPRILSYPRFEIKLCESATWMISKKHGSTLKQFQDNIFFYLILR